jgi:hypothetical protein
MNKFSLCFSLLLLVLVSGSPIPDQMPSRVMTPWYSKAWLNYRRAVRNRR